MIGRNYLLTPGSDATELNFAWYSNEVKNLQRLRISKNDDMMKVVDLMVIKVQL